MPLRKNEVSLLAILPADQHQQREGQPHHQYNDHEAGRPRRDEPPREPPQVRLGAAEKIIMSRGLSRDPDPFERTHYAATMLQKLKRSAQLGHKYYLWDLPRYFLDRRTLQLPLRDPGVFVNPFREFSRRVYSSLDLPPRYQESLRLLEAAGVRLAMPRGRLEALLGSWWTTHQLHGDVIECGSFGRHRAIVGAAGQASSVSESCPHAGYLPRFP